MSVTTKLRAGIAGIALCLAGAGSAWAVSIDIGETKLFSQTAFAPVSISDPFTAGSDLAAITWAVEVPEDAFTSLAASWTSGPDGTGTLFDSTSLLGAGSFTTIFGAGETRYLNVVSGALNYDYVFFAYSVSAVDPATVVTNPLPPAILMFAPVIAAAGAGSWLRRRRQTHA